MLKQQYFFSCVNTGEFLVDWKSLLIDWTVSCGLKSLLFYWTVSCGLKSLLIDWTVSCGLNSLLIYWTVSHGLKSLLIDWTVSCGLKSLLIDWTVYFDLLAWWLLLSALVSVGWWLVACGLWLVACGCGGGSVATPALVLYGLVVFSVWAAPGIEGPPGPWRALEELRSLDEDLTSRTFGPSWISRKSSQNTKHFCWFVQFRNRLHLFAAT